MCATNHHKELGPMMMRTLALVCLFWLAISPAQATGEIYRLALQVSDNNPEKMNAALNVAVNVTKHYEAQGDEVEIQIVAFNAGLHMLRTDTSPVKERLQSFASSMPNVAFKACGNTLDAMTRTEGTKPGIVANAEIVPAGVVTLMELSKKGWTIIRP
jgi:uncharacterized protein